MKAVSLDIEVEPRVMETSQFLKQRINLEPLFEIRVGDDILFNKTKSEFYADAQKTVQDVWGTEYALTHYATGFFPQPVRKNKQSFSFPQIFQASEIVNVSPIIEEHGSDFWIYRLRDIDQDLMDTVVTELWEELIGDPYGYLQILYFLRENFFKHNPVGKLLYPLVKIFHDGKEIEQWGNWFPENVVCSEIFHRKYRKYCTAKKDLEILNWLDKWDESNFSPIGIKKMFNSLPHRWSLIWKKESIEYKKLWL